MQNHAKSLQVKGTGPARNVARPNRAPVRPQLQPGLIQRAATLGKRDDAFEREADSVATRVANRTGPPETVAAKAPDGMVQRLTQTDSEGERPGEYLIQPMREGATSDDPTPRKGFLQRLFSLRLGGRALPDPVRSDMEMQMGEPFDEVRIHTGAQAHALSAEIGARAFTVGRDVVFSDGAYQPQSHTGRHLIAHELTHVVQQRGPQPEGAVAQRAPASLQRDALDFLPDVPSISSIVMGLVRDYAPQVAPILEKGPFDWLTGKLGGVFGGVVDKVSALNPGQHVDALVETFGKLVSTAADVVGALVSGDCGPMMAALGQMKAAVLEVGGKAWAKIGEFFAPVGEFFSDLWASITAVGGAAITWIKDFAGDIWDTIEDIGSYIWDNTQSIRDYGLGAWEWLTEQLFGPSEASAGNDERGIIGWFSDKAMEAWDWVKSRTRPVWEPVQEAVETVQELIPPDFVAELGEKMTDFADDVESTADELDQGNSVSENREALNSVLPSLDAIIDTVRGVIEGAGTFLTGAITKISGKVTSFMVKLRANDIVSFLAGALSWLETAIEGVSGWVTDKVDKLFEWYIKAFDFLSPFVKTLIETVGKVIEIAVDVMLLPKLLLTKAWELIPACIRDPIMEFVTNTVLAQIPVFNQLLQLGNLWAKVQEVAFQILRSIFVDGDIAKAAWTFFQAMLGLIGLPARLVVSILAKSARAYGMILRDPIGFLINLLKSMKEGFVLFFDNILTHLLNGVVGWLTGAVTAAGLTFPTELTFKSILEFVLQLLDITVERVMARLEKKIGKAKVDKLRRAIRFAEGAWAFLRVIIEEGVSGLWRFVQEKLSNLWTMVLQSTIGWIVEKIITEATIKILSMLDPSGIMLVINSCIAIYRAIETFIEQLNAMLQILAKVLDGVIDIAQGAISGAAGYLERALADSLPIGIAFLADQVGLGSLSDRIKEFVEGLRTLVDEAIDWLIDKALRFGRAFLDLVNSGIDLARAGIARLREWWRARTAFRNAAGETHSIYIEGQGSEAKVIIRSQPRTYSAFLSKRDDFTLDTEPKRTAYAGAVETSAELDEAIGTAASSQPSTAPATPQAQAATPADHGARIQTLINTLGDQTAVFMPGSAGADQESSLPVYGAPYHGEYGTVATVARLTNTVPREGSEANGMSDKWRLLRQRASAPGRRGTFYIRGHLLNRELGGTGDDWTNLTPLTRSANGLHETRFETHVKKRVVPSAASGAVPGAANFVCAVSYGRREKTTLADQFKNQTTPYTQGMNTADAEIISDIIRAEAEVPLSMDCSAHRLDEDGRQDTELARYQVTNDLQDDTETNYALRETGPRLPVLEINTADAAAVAVVSNIDLATAGNFVAARTARNGVNITRWNILENLSLNGTPVFSPAQITQLKQTYRVSFR